MEIGSFGVKDIMLIQWEEIKKVIEEYIKNQIQEDLAYEQMSLKEYIDPFTGGPDFFLIVSIDIVFLVI